MSNDLTQKGVHTRLQDNKSQFKVCRDFIDGRQETTARGLTSRDAGVEFLRCSNNVSAIAGLIERVTIQDEIGIIYVQWIHGRGYSDDGERYCASPYEL